MVWGAGVANTKCRAGNHESWPEYLEAEYWVAQFRCLRMGLGIEGQSLFLRLRSSHFVVLDSQQEAEKMAF
jgi:hypothetical protein